MYIYDTAEYAVTMPPTGLLHVQNKKLNSSSRLGPQKLVSN